MAWTLTRSREHFQERYALLYPIIKTLLLATVFCLSNPALWAHSPEQDDPEYLKEFDRRLPNGTLDLLSRLVDALNERDWSFFNFFCDEDAKAEFLVNIKPKVLNGNLKFDVAEGSHTEEEVASQGYGIPIEESFILSARNGDKLVGVYRLTITWTDPDGWLSIRSIHLHPADSHTEEIVSPTPSEYVTPEKLAEATTGIPNPTEEQATAAFNDLQDQFRRPHVKSVVYDATTDSYRWIGPKTGKKMSMKRSQFLAEIWTGYYKKISGMTE